MAVRLILGKKWPTLVSDVDSGEGQACGGHGVYGESVPSAQFCCEQKLLRKVKSTKKKRR